MMEPNFLPVHEAARLIQDGALSADDLIRACYGQIERQNPRLNAFITVIPAAVEASSGGEANTETAARGLHGIPVALKDLFETKEVRTTAGSRFFADHIPQADSGVVESLKREGARIIGKTNTHEIALGLTCDNPHFGTCRNPWNLTRIPGGSSGGSAVAVAAGMALAALGTDTGGSIRIPASLCGVVGLKPTYGRVSLRGVVPLSWHLDHAGPLTRTVKDAAILLQTIAGFDPEDPWSSRHPVDDYMSRLEEGIAGWRVGIGAGEYVESAEPEILYAVNAGAESLKALGAEIHPVNVSFLREAAHANGLMTEADGAAYHRERLAEHAEWFGEDVRRRLEAGRDLKSADYVLARRTQATTKRRLEMLLDEFQILILPTTPICAPPISGQNAAECARRLTRFTSPFNLAGVPAISIPCGMSHEGLPIGMQMIGSAWQEAALLRAAFAYEAATHPLGRRPPDL